MLQYYVTVYDNDNKLLFWYATSNKQEAEKASHSYNLLVYCYSKIERKEDLYEKAFQYGTPSQHSQVSY